MKEMEIPVIDFGEINGEERSKTMALLNQACEQWGFFQVKWIIFYFIFSFFNCKSMSYAHLIYCLMFAD